MGEVIASLVDGRFTPDFAEGFGASLLMSTKEGTPGGHAIQFPEKLLVISSSGTSTRRTTST